MFAISLSSSNTNKIFYKDELKIINICSLQCNHHNCVQQCKALVKFLPSFGIISHFWVNLIIYFIRLLTPKASRVLLGINRKKLPLFLG